MKKYFVLLISIIVLVCSLIAISYYESSYESKMEEQSRNQFVISMVDLVGPVI